MWAWAIALAWEETQPMKRLQNIIAYLQDHWAGILMLYHALDLVLDGALTAITGDRVTVLPSLLDATGGYSPGCADAWHEFWSWLTNNSCAGGSR